MKAYFQRILLCTNLFSLLIFTACEEDEPVPVGLNFTNTELGISEGSSNAEVSLTFSRPVASAGSLSVVVSGDLVYGEDYITTPEVVENTLNVDYQTGDESVSFTVSVGPSLNIDQDESLTFTIDDSENLFDLGSNNIITITFSENFIAPSGTANLDAGGPEFTHQSFFDLSKIERSQVEKNSWDLGFSTGSDEFKVIINHSAKVMARRIDKFDLSLVTPEDTVGFGASQNFSAFNGDATDWVDAPNLDSLAIGAISSTDSENAVFIISREGEDQNWKKVRVLRNGDGFSLQYADIASESFETLEITKDEAYNYSFASFESGLVSVQPEKDSWDIMYGSFTNVINFGYFLPYSFSDFIIINQYNTQAAEILTDGGVAYEDFTSGNLANIEFSNSITTIGSNWRQGGGPGQAPSLLADRFYLIKDSQENIYKIKFTSMTSTDGERGHTEFLYELVGE